MVMPGSTGDHLLLVTAFALLISFSASHASLSWAAPITAQSISDLNRSSHGWKLSPTRPTPTPTTGYEGPRRRRSPERIAAPADLQL